MNCSDYSMELTPGGALRLAGNVDTYAAVPLHDELTRALRDQAALTVDLSEVVSCDFAAIQLLCSARRSAERAGKPFAVASLSEGVLQTCAALGVSPRSFGAAGSD